MLVLYLARPAGTVSPSGHGKYKNKYFKIIIKILFNEEFSTSAHFRRESGVYLRLIILKRLPVEGNRRLRFAVLHPLLGELLLEGLLVEHLLEAALPCGQGPYLSGVGVRIGEGLRLSRSHLQRICKISLAFLKFFEFCPTVLE